MINHSQTIFHGIVNISDQMIIVSLTQSLLELVLHAVANSRDASLKHLCSSCVRLIEMVASHLCLTLIPALDFLHPCVRIILVWMTTLRPVY